MSCQSPILVKNNRFAFERGWYKYNIVPCGKCPGCITHRRSDWAIRARRECQNFFHSAYVPFRGFSAYHLSDGVFGLSDESNLAWFFTFTYDDNHVPTVVDESTGELVPTLRFTDWTSFWHSVNKRRKRLGLNALSMLACGEYGSHTKRPHYHALILGLSYSEAWRICRQWQIKYCPSSIQYSNDVFVESSHLRDMTNDISGVSDLCQQTESLCRLCTPAPKKVNTFGSARHNFNDIGVMFSEVSINSGTSIGRVATYISKYVVKSDHDIYKTLPSVCQKPRVVTTKGFGLGYRFKAEPLRRLQDIAMCMEIKDLQKTWLPTRPKSTDGIYYDRTFIDVLAHNLTFEEHGFRKHQPRYIVDKVFPKQDYIVLHDRIDEKRISKLRDYPLYETKGVRLSCDLRFALSHRSAEVAEKRISDLYATWLSVRRLTDSVESFALYVRESYLQLGLDKARRTSEFGRLERERAGTDNF